MITNRIGSSFATPIVIIGVVITFIGVLAAIEDPLFGSSLVLVGSFIWSNSYGIQIDIENQRFREFGSFYGLKTGKWRSLSEMPFVAVLCGRSGTTVLSRSNIATTVTEGHYDVCLLSKTHRTKYVIQKFKDKEQAVSYSNEMASTLGKDLVKYYPEVSESTRSRRRRK